MAIRASCSACGAKLKADDRHAGRTVACPGCRQPLTIPSAESVAAVEPDRFIDPFAEDAEALASPPLPRIPKAPASPPAASSPSAKTLSAKTPERKLSRPEPPAEPNFDEEIAASEAASEPDDSLFPDLSEEDLAGEVLSPPKKRKQQERKQPLAAQTTAVSTASPRKRLAAVELPATSWRQHLHWVLILALVPLVLSTVWGDSPDIREQIQRSLNNHPEVNEAAVWELTSLHDVAMQFPEHQLDGAFLPADTYWHWGFALASGGVFLSLFLFMWPGKESRVPVLLTTGVITGTIGILLLLGFQWVAFSTDGMRVWGMSVLPFDIVKFIGFSYRGARDGNSGFLASFFGFTFGVGLCGELCKALPVAFSLTRPGNRTFREVCLVGLASGVGFGVSEGITYSSESYNGIRDPWIYLIRFLSCVSLHAIWAGGVALLMYRNQDSLEWAWKSIVFFVVFSLLMAMILHGVSDTLLKQDHELLAVLAALVSFVWFQWILSRASQEAGES